MIIAFPRGTNFPEVDIMTSSAALRTPSLFENIFARLLAVCARARETAASFGNADGYMADDAELDAERLIDSYGNSVLRLAYSYLHSMEDAEDILQDTLIKYLSSAPAFESPAHEKAWLLRVAANLSKNRIDYNSVRRADELDESLAAEKREDLSFVWEAVRSLPDEYREVVHLFYCEGCSTAEIAGIVGRKESTVRSCLSRGRDRLREVLKEAYDFGD
jgi:RNA polymerase sigma factor (sigma-70 family)